MTTEQLVLILGGVGTFLGVVLTAYRSVTGDRFTRKATESAALLSGYTEMVRNLRLELIEVRKDNEVDVERSKKQCLDDVARMERLHKQELDGIIAVYGEERRLWEQQRVRLQEQFDADRSHWEASRAELRERIEELASQVYVLTNRSSESRTRLEDET